MSENTNTSTIVFDEATKTYPGAQHPALDRLSLSVDAGELVCLVGPSGGGKTTALQMVNRLVDITSGDIRIGDTSITDMPAIELRRTIGYAIQQSGLFPHMTVAENIGIVPSILGWDKDRIRQRSHELLELVGLTPVENWEKRYPSQLSGGQQQRVGIARALAADPPVMLMDEPFGALDPITRTTVQDEFLEVQRAVGKTTLFVTHDIDEAIKMGDRIAILKPGGLLAQFDTPERLLTEPADDFVAEFLGQERGLKRLALYTLSDLDGLGGPGDTTGTTPWPEIASTITVREALSIAAARGAEGVLVTGEDGAPVASAPLSALVHLQRKENAA